MSVELRWDLRHADDSTEATMLVSGPTDRNGVIADLLANIPLTYGALSLQRITSIEQIAGYTDAWTASVRYGVYHEKPDMSSGDSEFHFANGSRTFTRTVSRSSIVYDSGGVMSPQPTDAQIIGWNPASQTADGTEDEENVNTFGWTVIVPFTTATASWRQQAGGLRGSVNSESFFGYSAGEVYMQDMRSTVRADGEYRIELNFMQAPNETGLTIGGVTVAEKKAWDVLDIDDQSWEWETSAPYRLMPKVKAVKVHTIKPSKDWTLLSDLLAAALS